VQIHDRGAYNSSHPAPYLGETRRLKLRYGVITESVTRTNYCNAETAPTGTCGT
jgi:hypothetical protein